MLGISCVHRIAANELRDLNLAARNPIWVRKFCTRQFEMAARNLLLSM